MGRPRLPAEMKALKGTINTTREKNAPASAVDHHVLSFGADVRKISCPKAISDPYVKKFWRTYTALLLQVRVLGPGDIPQLTRMCVILQKLREVEKVFLELDVTDRDFDAWELRYRHLGDSFDKLASKFYLTPAERAKMKLDELTIAEKQLAVGEKEKDAINRLLGMRK